MHKYKAYNSAMGLDVLPYIEPGTDRNDIIFDTDGNSRASHIG